MTSSHGDHILLPQFILDLNMVKAHFKISQTNHTANIQIMLSLHLSGVLFQPGMLIFLAI